MDASASGADEIGTAMQKAAATATEAGLSFEWLGAYIATISEKTRQAPEVIGTSLNSMMSRLQSIKQMGYNEEDETKINDISKALNKIDVAIMDNEGNWRDMSDIFMDIAMQWTDLDDKTRAYIATTMAGTRQKNYFLTLMNDLSKVTDETGDASRAMELYEGAMNAAGSAAKKYKVYEESVTAANDRMNASFEKLYSLFSSEFLKDWYDFWGDAAEGIYNAFDGDTFDYTPTITLFQEQYTWIEKLRDEYVQLENTKNRTEIQDKRMVSILDELTGGNRILATELKTAEGGYVDAEEAVKKMNKELERNLELFRQYSLFDLKDRIMDTEELGKALDSWEDAKEIPKLDKLFADLATFQGIDISNLDEDTADSLVDNIHGALSRRLDDVHLPFDQ